MALKSERTIIRSSYEHFATRVMSRGRVIWATKDGCYGPVGILMEDVVNIDLTSHPLRILSGEVQVYSKVSVLEVGTVITNCISKKCSPKAGDLCFFNSRGLFNTTKRYLCGKFLSNKDHNGFAKIEFDINLYREITMC